MVVSSFWIFVIIVEGFFWLLFLDVCDRFFLIVFFVFLVWEECEEECEIGFNELGLDFLVFSICVKCYM